MSGQLREQGKISSGLGRKKPFEDWKKIRKLDFHEIKLSAANLRKVYVNYLCPALSKIFLVSHRQPPESQQITYKDKLYWYVID